MTAEVEKGQGGCETGKGGPRAAVHPFPVCTLCPRICSKNFEMDAVLILHVFGSRNTLTV